MKTFYSALFCLCCCLLHAQPPCPDGESTVVVTIATDNFGYETHWTLTGESGTVYAEVNPDTYANSTVYQTQACLPADDCATFEILDTYGDGIFLPGGYILTVDGDTIATGANFGAGDRITFNCAPTQKCDSALPVSEGSYIATYDDSWYAFTPDSSGLYSISTCGLAACDTKIWIYDTCEDNGLAEDNSGTIFFDDGTAGCDPQAMVSAFFDPSQTYLIRIGDHQDACPDSIAWELVYEGPVTGCTDPESCNYSPLATVDDGSCLPQGDPNCPRPDLNLRQDVLNSTIYVDTITSVDECLIQEGCLKGYGLRDIIRFSTKIENIGQEDYYIGEPSFDNTQFTWNNCHNHFHYDSYAEYVLFDEAGTEIPIGFKNGFCVIDLGCTTGSAQYGCGNMGISAGCYDEYWPELECQWIDVTDIPDGNYTFVTRVNWLGAPDFLGRYELDSLNNWAQSCITIDRSSGELEVFVDPDCPPYVDCAGIPYGATQPDCNGECGGAAVRGDLDENGLQEMVDAQTYVDRILGNDIEPLPCNDLNADGDITVYDAALLASCLNYGAAHVHVGEGLHDHCRFPGGLLNTTDTVELTILDADFAAGYVDIGIRNPTALVNAYQFDMSGLTIASVENLADPAAYPITPRASIDQAVVIGVSYQDSMIFKSPAFQPLVRLHYLELTDDFICIDNIIDIVNHNHEQVVARIVDGCVENTTSATRFLDNSIEVSVQPNPFHQSALLRFRNPLQKAHQLVLTDLSGRIVRSYGALRSNELTIERDNLPAGIYLFKLTGPDGAAVGRLNVQ